MLIVSSFRPIPRISDDRNSSINNFRKNQINFTSTNFNAVNLKHEYPNLFASLPKELRKTPAPLIDSVEEAAGRILKDYSDVLGEGKFQEKFLGPMNEYLEKNNIVICHKVDKKRNFYIYNRDGEIDWTSTDVFIAMFKKKEEDVFLNSELSGGYADIRPWGITENHAKFELFRKFINGELEVNELDNKDTLIYCTVIPKKLIKTINRINDALEEFRLAYQKLQYDNESKLIDIKKAFDLLMPMPKTA